MKTTVINPATFDGRKFAIEYGLSQSPFSGQFFCSDNGNGTKTLHFPDSLPDNPNVVHALDATQVQIIQRILTSPLFVNADWNAPAGSAAETAHAQVQNKAAFDALNATQKAEALRLEAVIAIQQREALRVWSQKIVKYILQQLEQGD